MSDAYVILVGANAWRVARVRASEVCHQPVPVVEASDMAAQAAACAEALRTLGWHDQVVLLGLPATWCLQASVSTADLKRSGRSQALAYRLEEHLPISAEEFVADFLETGDGQALGVCTEYQRLAAWLQSLETAGVRVGYVCPTALLAAADSLRAHPELDGLVLAETPSDKDAPPTDWNLLRFHQGQLSAWRWHASPGAAWTQDLKQMTTIEGTPLRLGVFPAAVPMVRETLKDSTVTIVDMPEADMLSAAARQAARILDGTCAPWINLRCGRLAAPRTWRIYRQAMRVALAGGILLLLSVAAVAGWRAFRFSVLTAELQRQQIEVFRATMPNQALPASIKSKLLSERQKLQSLHGPPPVGAAGENMNFSALETLRDILRHLPNDWRHRVLDLNIQPDMIRLEGQCISHIEAERLAGSLRQTGWLEVDAPRTQALKEEGVSFILVARPRRGGDAVTGGRP